MISVSTGTTFKIAVIGPQRVGKTALCNTLSEFSSIPSTDYRPTAGCRILEFDKEFTDDQIKNIDFLKRNHMFRLKIQLWDVSGDKRYENCWPAIKQDVNGVIVVIDAKNNKYDNVLDDWVNGFCSDLNLDNVVCFSYSKDNEKSEKQKVSNQFPNMTIVEVTNDYNTLLPQFNKILPKLFTNFCG